MAVILVVDDDADTCESLARFLRKSNCAVVCANDGQQAMASLMDNKPDLVLLDLKMPEMDGIDFLHVIRSYLRWTSLPVIVITGILDQDVEKQALKLGVRKVFTKTALQFDELLNAIQSELTSA
jgi:CheY-like chemotaxis protein